MTQFTQKKHYRQRAHANPFSDHALDYPKSPESIDWTSHFPAFMGTKKTPEFADVGCGFGGLLISLSPLFPDVLMLGQCFVFTQSLIKTDIIFYQDWKSAYKSLNMFKIGSALYVPRPRPRHPPRLVIKTSPWSVLTP